MPKLACPCGFVHDLSPIPDDGWITILDRAYDELIASELRSQQGAEIPEFRVTDYWGRLYECPSCGRIMWEKLGEEKFTVYRRDPS